MRLSLALITALAAELSSAAVGLGWGFPNAAQPGLNDITFPFDLSKAPHMAGFYFAQQFFFNGVNSGAYTGLQPRPNNSEGSVVHAVFSSFIGGTTSKSPNCGVGSDGGPGVHCRLDFNGDYSHKYELVVTTTDGGSTWRGTIVDTVTGKSHLIGEWTLPKKAAGIKTKGKGFVEYYIRHLSPDGEQKCNTEPLTEVSFFSPTSNTKGANHGTLGKPYEYGTCRGRTDVSTQKINDGYFVKTGF